MVMFSNAQRTSDWRYGTPPFLGCRRRDREVVAPLSARKLAASLWRFVDTSPCGGTVRLHCGLSFNRLGSQCCSSIPVPKFAMEGATKWDHCNDSRAWDICADDFESKVKLTSSAAFAEHVNEREASSRKMNEERALRMRREQQRKKLTEAIERERKKCKSMDRMNADMLRDIVRAKASTRKLIWHLEREKKARRELECVYYDLANEIRGRKAEIGALRNEQRRIKEGMEAEKEMRQIAEVWREEAVQMKLADAKLILEDKNKEINELMDVLREFVRRSKLRATATSEGEAVKQHLEVEAAGKVLAVVKEANSSQVLDKSTGVSVVAVTHEADILNNKMRSGNQNVSKTKRILIDGNGKNPHGDIGWPKAAAAAKLDSQKMPLRNLLKHNTAA